MTEIEKLMKEYFKIKDESKRLKSKRLILSGCEGEHCIYDGTKEIDFCDSCRSRHEVHKRIVELGYKRTGIILKVRGKLNKMK